MANAVGARLAGDDFQHQLAWLHLLELLMPDRGVVQVAIEDSGAAFADDVTVVHSAESQRPDRFYQVKFHVDHRSGYSTEVLLDAPTSGRSLLQKLYESWRTLRLPTGRPLEIHLVSNWTWDSRDPVGREIRGWDSALADHFFTASTRSWVGRARERWKAHLKIDEPEFSGFVRCLRFRLGFGGSKELEERVADRMQSLGLRHDPPALRIAIGRIREAIQRGRSKFERQDFEKLLREEGLYLPRDAERATTVHIVGIKQHRFDLPPDHLLDWRNLFAGDTHQKGREVVDPSSWNGRMLPELQALERTLSETTTTRLIRARGLARLSHWFAFGYTFSRVARYTIEVAQGDQLWRTDAPTSELSLLETQRSRFKSADTQTVAVGLSVTGSIEKSVRGYLKNSRAAHTALFLQIDRGLDPKSIRTASDVVAFAQTSKARLRTFVEENRAHRLLLFYFGPLSGACFLGHLLNAVAPEVQIMEHVSPGYEPSFLLT